MLDRAIEVLSNGDFCNRYPFVRLMFTFDDVQELALVYQRQVKEKTVVSSNGHNKKSHQ